jgi:prepilin-type N-terminal cleavage/methylation domain-containing protein
MKTKLNKEKGFTIIEVLIVLAIAGLILLIIFLAVPALQRNNRNTQRANNVAALLGGASEFANNNNGSMPNTCTGTGTITLNRTPGTWTTAEVNSGYYNIGCSAGATSTVGRVGLTAGAVAASSSDNSQDWVNVTTGAKCNPTGTAAITGPARGVAAVYQIEIGTGATGGFGSVCKAA